VMGRCRFIDEHDRFIGVEHPSAFESHERVLAIWKGYTIPQPAVFWTREVWDTCGPLDEHDHLVLDYDLFCRFSRRYRFHTIDQVVANYRLHEASKTQGMDDEKRLGQAVQVSRKYWPSAVTPTGLALRASWAAHRFDRRGRAYRHLVAARGHWRDGHWPAAAAAAVPGALLGPEVALAGLAAPFARRGGRVARSLAGLAGGGASAGGAQSSAWRDFTQVHADGWAGPTVRVPFERGTRPGEHLVLAGDAPLPLPAPLVLTVRVSGGAPLEVTVAAEQPFRVQVPIDALAPGTHVVEVAASSSVVPHDLWGNGDHRPLSYRLHECAVHETA
jgi:hypothetical protein